MTKNYLIILLLTLHVSCFCARAGWQKVKEITPHEIWDYLKDHEVPSYLALQLDQVFRSSIIHNVFNALDHDHYDEAIQALDQQGITFLSSLNNVFIHRNFPEYVFKIPRTHDQILLNL